MAQPVKPFEYYDAVLARQMIDNDLAVACISIFSDRTRILGQLSDCVLEAGYVIHDAAPLALLGNGEKPVLADVVIVDAPLPRAETLAALARLDMRSRKGGAQLIVITGQEGLDAVFGCCDQSEAQILVSPSAAEQALALGIALSRRSADAVHEVSGGIDRMTLLRLTEQMQQLSRSIESFAEEPGIGGAGFSEAEYREPGQGVRLNAPSMAFFGPAAARRAANASSGDDQPSLPPPALLREIIRQRQLRARFFDGELFADPAWDMLLDLAAAQAEGKQVCVSSLCIAACVPPTTALRWMGQMTEAGLLRRVQDPADRRRAFIALSADAGSAMARYFAQLGPLAAVI